LRNFLYFFWCYAGGVEASVDSRFEVLDFKSQGKKKKKQKKTKTITIHIIVTSKLILLRTRLDRSYQADQHDYGDDSNRTPARILLDRILSGDIIIPPLPPNGWL